MAAEVILNFMTGNPQLGVLSGRLTYLDNSSSSIGDSKSPALLPEKEGVSNVPQDAQQHGLGLNADAPCCSSNSRLNLLPTRRSTLLCVLSVPAYMVLTDMLQFAAPFKEHLHSIRILRPCNPFRPGNPARTPAEYVVLLQMDSQASADYFFRQCNGKRFNSLEEALCRVVFVATVTFDLSAPSSSVHAAPITLIGAGSVSGGGTVAVTIPTFDSAPASNVLGGGERDSPLRPAVRFAPDVKPGHGRTAGLPSPEATGWEYDALACVICMDRMESGVLTTICNHSFHVECLTKWQDSPCPVCRFHHNNASEASTCQECQAINDLWVCLICGSVFCGSRYEDHVRGHYTDTLHAYAIEIETQQVWDFAGDGFVHRLIHNKADGKLVEISDPAQTSQERPQTPARLSDIQEERLVHGKLEGLAYQYNTLLTSQLDEQRHFYQKQLNGLLEQQEKARQERRATMISAGDLISALRRQRRELESKCASASARLQKTREETGFLRELNRSLEANKEQWSVSLEQARRDLDSARKTRDELVPKLEEKVEQLMLKLDNSGGGVGGGGGGEGGRSGNNDTTSGVATDSCSVANSSNTAADGIGGDGDEKIGSSDKYGGSSISRSISSNCGSVSSSSPGDGDGDCGNNRIGAATAAVADTLKMGGGTGINMGVTEARIAGALAGVVLDRERGTEETKGESAVENIGKGGEGVLSPGCKEMSASAGVSLVAGRRDSRGGGIRKEEREESTPTKLPLSGAAAGQSSGKKKGRRKKSK